MKTGIERKTKAIFNINKTKETIQLKKLWIGYKVTSNDESSKKNTHKKKLNANIFDFFDFSILQTIEMCISNVAKPNWTLLTIHFVEPVYVIFFPSLSVYTIWFCVIIDEIQMAKNILIRDRKGAYENNHANFSSICCLRKRDCEFNHLQRKLILNDFWLEKQIQFFFFLEIHSHVKWLLTVKSSRIESMQYDERIDIGRLRFTS